MVDTPADEVRVAAVVAFLIVAFGSRHGQFLGTGELTLREAVLTHTLSLGNSSSQTTEDVVLLTADGHRESLLGTADEEGAAASRSTHERRIGQLAQLAETDIQHRAYETIHIVGTNILLVVLLVVRGGVALHIEVGHDDGLLLVLLNGDNHLVIVGHGIIDALCRIHRLGNLREEGLDFLFYLVDINVAHHHDSLQVRAIPLLIVVAQVLIREVVDNVHRTDGQTVLILRALVDGRHGVLHQSLHGHAGTARAPLLMNDTTLLVNLLVLQQNVVAPVVQHQQTRVQDALALQGSRADVIDRLVYRGVGIEIGTELDADGFAPGHDAQFTVLAREVFRTVEGHVFQEVGQSALPRFLQDGAHPLGNVEVGQPRLLGVVAQIVSQSVV